MEKVIESVLTDFESGRITRRQMVAQLSALAVGISAAADAPAPDSGPSFQATGYNHIALRVTDVAKSRDFYVKHLGVKVAREALPDNSFLTFGSSFLTLFKGDKGSLDHYCYSVENFSVLDAEKKLRALGLNPDQPK